MEKFLSLEGAKVGRGPRHPVSPHPSLDNEITAFLDQYPFLKRDQGYLDFLECYAGAWIMSDNLVIDIFGFTDVSSHILELEGPVVDTDGYLTICDGEFRAKSLTEKDVTEQLGCGFDATGTRKWGLYRNRGYRSGELGIYWYCETFLEWLEALVDAKGKLPHKVS
jgi:hypothetical protein